MFPYFSNNGSPLNGSSVPYAPIALGRSPESMRNLPEEVKESIEAHKNNFRDEADIKAFISRLDMKK